MKTFNVKFQENENQFLIQINSENYLRELVVEKNDDKLVELGLKGFVGQYLGNKLYAYAITTISENEFRIVTTQNNRFFN